MCSWIKFSCSSNRNDIQFEIQFNAPIKIAIADDRWIAEEPFLQSKNSIWMSDLLDWCVMYANKYNSTIASNLIENSQCEFIHLWSQRIAMGQIVQECSVVYLFETSTRVPMLFTWQIKIFHTHTQRFLPVFFYWKKKNYTISLPYRHECAHTGTIDFGINHSIHK